MVRIMINNVSNLRIVPECNADRPKGETITALAFVRTS
ncbi:MAG: hypothetical protein ACI8S3_001345 [Alphaproteobacteria bacterium]